MSEKTIIVLSERPPVSIDVDEWPLIAEASWFDNSNECQANRKAFVRVRQHEDGRTLVYASLHAGPGGVPVQWRGAQGGYLLDAPVSSEDLVRAIRRCGGVIDMSQLADECIADLPAEEL